MVVALPIIDTMTDYRQHGLFAAHAWIAVISQRLASSKIRQSQLV
jgi:hypothetical protein